MKKPNLFVSVIIPVYNGAKFLGSAIQCVQKQNYSPLEIIVIDDGSTDRTGEIASQFKDITYVYQNNQGPAIARNRGIKMAKGDVIAFLDVDDLWSDNKLQLQVDYLAEHAEVEIVQGLIQQMQLQPNTVDSDELQFIISSPPYQFINLGSAVYRKSVFDKVGLFDEQLWDNEDTDWFYSAWKANINKVVLQEVTMFYRLHDRNLVLEQKDLIYYGLPKIFKKHLDLARQQGGLCHLRGQLPRLYDFIGETAIDKENRINRERKNNQLREKALSVEEAKEKLKQFKQKLNQGKLKKTIS